MRFLIDTHVFLWFINGDRRLNPAVRSAIEDTNNNIYSDLIFTTGTSVGRTDGYTGEN